MRFDWRRCRCSLLAKLAGAVYAWRLWVITGYALCQLQEELSVLSTDNSVMDNGNEAQASATPAARSDSNWLSAFGW